MSSTGAKDGRGVRQALLFGLFLVAAIVPGGLALVSLKVRLDAGLSPEAGFRGALVGLLVAAGTAAVLGTLAVSLLRRRSRTVANGSTATAREGQFLARAARQLEAPLVSIREKVDEVLSRERTATEYKKALEEVTESSRLAGSLVESLLLLARIDTGSVKLEETLSTAELATAAVRDEKTRHPGATLLLRKDGDSKVLGNRELLLRALGSLVANSLRHGGEGVKVEVFSGVDGQSAVVGVDDDGPGIPPEEAERVLLRFEQGASEGKPGTGLGLPIADGFARAHRGRLEISRSALGGCRALIRLPLA